MPDEFRKGDRVTWNSHGGTAGGTIRRTITSDTEAAGRTAVHEPSALRRADAGED
jgi:hypothetical protein